MKKLIFSLLFTLVLQIGWAQGKVELRQHFTNLTDGKKTKIDKTTMAAFRQNAGVVAALQPYLTSEQVEVQRAALQLAVQIGTQHEYAVSRMQMVNQLLGAAEQVESAQLGRIAKGLQQFKRADFDEAAEKQVARLIKMERPHTSKFIELAGFLQMYEVLDELRFAYKSNKHLFRSMSMALTRSGDEQKRNNLMKNVAKYRVDDEFVYGILPKLVYARQKETTDYLFEIILKDQKTCSYPAHGHQEDHEEDHEHKDGHEYDHDHEHGQINCAYRVMETLAPYVKGIPLQLGASGDLLSNDYQQALKTTREWILANRDNYELRTDLY
ncbi:MAG: hypothetical protein AAF985_07405 [Bacteroidota bacterium]